MQNKPTTIKELCEFIWYLEEKYDLLDFEIDGVKVWQYTRMELYYKLAELFGILEKPHSSLTRLDNIKYIFKYIRNSLVDNYFTLKKVNVIVFPHPRTVKVNNKFIDIYTKYFVDELKENNSVIEFESAYLGQHKKEKEAYAHYIDWIGLTQRIYKIFFRTNFSKEKIKKINKIEEEIKNICEIDINIVLFTNKAIRKFKATYSIYNKVFQKVKPSKIILVVSYTKAPIIKAAKDNNIEVIELQHGIFSDYHLGYSFPNLAKELEYFPDKFYIWNDMWRKMLKMPINNKNIIIDKFRYLEVEKLKYLNVTKDKNQIVVLSQGAIGNKIALCILNNYERFKNYKIKYKLHPGEFDRWQSYPDLIKLNKNKNVEIIKDEVDLYYLFASSEVQVGVFSTAIYEGVEFDCKTILLNIPGIEYMRSFIKVQKNVETIGEY